MSNPQCEYDKTHHKYMIKFKCEICNRNNTDIITRVCMRPDPRMRMVACKGCRSKINMVFKCGQGYFDDDFWQQPGGTLYCRVENIDG